jgi:5-methylthioribose kinase
MNIEKGYYISSGELTAMYTLNFGHGVHESGDYIVNLSTDAETAVKKAMDYVNAQGDIYPLDTSYADVSLNDIIRRNQEQIEARQPQTQSKITLLTGL